MEVKKRSQSIPGIEKVLFCFVLMFMLLSLPKMCVCMFERQGDTDRQEYREGRQED